MKCSHRGNETFPGWEQIASRRQTKSPLGCHVVLLLIVEVPIRNVVVELDAFDTSKLGKNRQNLLLLLW